MRLSILAFSFLLISACSSSSTNSDQGVFNLQDNIDVADLEGLWVNACVPSEDYENTFQREFLDYKSGYISNSESQITYGNQYFSDANCTQPPEADTSLTDVIYIPYNQGVSTDFSAIGIYTTNEGIQAKVLELSTEVNQSTSLAYFVNAGVLYFSFENNAGYSFNYENAYNSEL